MQSNMSDSEFESFYLKDDSGGENSDEDKENSFLSSNKKLLVTKTRDLNSFFFFITANSY